MYAKKVTIDAIDDGLDRKQLEEIKKRFLRVNQSRLQRTRDALAVRQQVVIDLLPVLLHINHPALPGYVNHQCPAGICNYKPTKEVLKQTTSLARSFRFNPQRMNDSAIEALFVMGSGGTIAHSKSSDLDIWVCHGESLDTASKHELEKKCQKLSRWAADLDLEIHFFLMVANDFKAGKFARFGKESSGSAQHLLLLDEFYRTALWLAGKLPLWWFIPSEHEQDYEHYAHILLSRRYLLERGHIDFGPVAKLPAGEFVGAGIWQMYKAIESPYKSVLKLLLLEAYAKDYPNTSALSLLFKQCIYHGELDINHLDPYFLIYRCLENYLLQQQDQKRLELVRRCFYFKVGKKLTKPITGVRKSWQRVLLEQLVQGWQWKPEHLKLLDHRTNWKADWVILERRALVNELTNCYRFLVDFARQEQGDVRIDPQEFSILGRKLHASFERRAGKIEWINPGISDNLSEGKLVFNEHYDEFLHDTKWSVSALREPVSTSFTARILESAQSQELSAAEQHIELKQSRYLVDLLVWCYCNGLLSQTTRGEIHTVNSTVSQRLLEQLHVALRRWLPLPLKPVAHDTFGQPTYLLTAYFLVNIGVDPFPDLYERGIQKVSEHGDALNFGSDREDLVISIDLITVNSWNEIEVHHFEGEALLRCLLFFFRSYPPERQQAQPHLAVYCATAGYGNTIRQRLDNLLRELQRCFYSNKKNQNLRYLFEVAGNYYSLQICDSQPKLLEAQDQEEFLRILSQKQDRFSPLMVDQYALAGSAVKLMAGVSDSTSVQVFYSARGKIADVFVLDEKGSLFKTEMAYSDEPTLLRPLYQFIRAAIDRQNIQGPNPLGGFGVYPIEIYRLGRTNDAQKNVRSLRHYFGDHCHYTHIERCRVGSDLTQLSYINIEVIAQPVAPNHLSFRIYCDDVEFSELQYGPKLFREVARSVLSLRRQRQPYPCYITDLDLSQCLSLIAPNGQLQISHYLEIKAALETKLNTALRALE